MWYKHFEVNGQVTRQMSPFELNVVGPLIKGGFSNMFHMISKFLLEGGPAVAIGAYVYYWAEKKHKEIAFHHRA